MAPRGNLAELNQAAGRYMQCRKVRWYAVWELVMSALCFWVPFTEPHTYNFRVLIPAGVYFFMDAVWNLLYPSMTFRFRQVLSGVVFVFAFWGTRGSRLVALPNWAEQVLVACVGLLPASYVIELVLQSGRFGYRPPSPPPRNAMEVARQIVREISKAKPTEEPDIVAFNAEGRWARAKLMGDLAWFVHRGRRAELVRRDEVECVVRENRPMGKWTKVLFRIGDWELKGRIEAEFLQRFLEWKSSSEPHAGAEPANARKC